MLLLERGVDCTVLDNKALQIACARNHVQICELLFRFGASLPPITKPQRIVFDAVGRGSIELLELLLRHGADLNVLHDEFQSSTLQYALQNSDCADRLAWLLEHGVPLHLPGQYGHVLCKAIKQLRVESFHFLLKRLRSEFDHSALCADGSSSDAAVSEATATLQDVEALQQKHFAAHLDRMVDSQRETPLHCAARSSDPIFTERLLSLGLTVDARDGFGATPLFSACWHGRYESARVLIAHGADVNATASWTTPLLLATGSAI